MQLPTMVVGLDDQRPRAQTRDGGLDRWAGQAQQQLLSFHKGRIVKRVDSGLMMEFADARSCLQAAFALGQPGGTQLRAAAHLAQYTGADPSERDARLVSDLAQQARPGEVLVTADLRDKLADGLDADFEDLGLRRPRPAARQLRLFRAHPGQTGLPGDTLLQQGDLRPGLAVIPFSGSPAESRRWVVGELVAEGVIARLSHSLGIRVISRQSTSALRDCNHLGEIERHLGAAFVLSGSYATDGRKLVLSAELAEACSHTLLWSGELRGSVDDLLCEDSDVLHRLALTVAQVLTKAQVRQAMARPLPRLDSSLLLLAGIAMTHSHSARTFLRGREALAELAQRHPELALPKAWLGMWHTLAVVKGQSAGVAEDTRLAREYTLRALDAEPNNAMALAVDGHIHCQLLGNPEQARKSLDAAIEANPSEPMAWLFKSLYSCMWGSSTASVTEACIARSLSPVDPLRYFFDMLMGNALMADQKPELAMAYAQRSVRANKHHAPALRLLMTAQAELGLVEEGRQTLQALVAEVPGLTVSSYLGMGSTSSGIRQRIAAAMRQLGLPER